MDQEELRNYILEYNKIRETAKTRHNLTDNEIEHSFTQSFKNLSQNRSAQTKCSLLTKLTLITTIILFILYILLYVHQPTSSLVLRNVQSFIYPGFKLVRYLSMPIITLFPSLTALYDESCLIENPYFQVSNLDCYPCENVHSVINLIGINNHTYENYETETALGTPFIITDGRKVVLFEDIFNIYRENVEIFNENAWKIHSNQANLFHLKDLFPNLLNNNKDNKEHKVIDKETHISWRINRMLPARLVRKLFPRPGFMSEWSGQAIERYVFIDGQESPGYLLPSFECSYVFLVQGSGERNIILQPTAECTGKCRAISATLKTNHILWYNWWYWKPVSLPAENSTNISISYISSYC